MKLLNIKRISLITFILSACFYLYCGRQNSTQNSSPGSSQSPFPPSQSTPESPQPRPISCENLAAAFSESVYPVKIFEDCPPKVHGATLWCRYETEWGLTESKAGLDENKNPIIFPADNSLYSWACQFGCPHYLKDNRPITWDLYFMINDTPGGIERTAFEKKAIESCEKHTPHPGNKFVEYGIRSDEDLQPYLFHKPFFSNVPNTIAKNALPFSRIVIFGDSISDNGNFWDVTGHAILQWPYFMGRFSNGPVWVDYLAKEISEQQPSNPVEIYNYAVGGSAAVTSGYNYAFSNLDKQVDQYLDEMKTENESIPINPGYDKTLYTIFIGTNDYMVLSDESFPNLYLLCGLSADDASKAFNAFTTIGTKAKLSDLENPSPEIATAINELRKSLASPCAKALITGENSGPSTKTRSIKKNIENIIEQATHEKNVKNFFFLLPAEPDMTLLPYYNFKSILNLKKPEASIYQMAFVKLLSQEHNNVLNALKKELTLKYKTEKQINIHFLNLKLDEILRGFADDTSGEYFDILNKIEIKDKVNACFTGSALALLPSTNFCLEPKNKLFWDQVHPATATHCAIAKLALKQMYSDLLINSTYKPYYEACRGSPIKNPVPIPEFPF